MHGVELRCPRIGRKGDRRERGRKTYGEIRTVTLRVLLLIVAVRRTRRDGIHSPQASSCFRGLLARHAVRRAVDGDLVVGGHAADIPGPAVHVAVVGEELVFADEEGGRGVDHWAADAEGSLVRSGASLPREAMKTSRELMSRSS